MASLTEVADVTRKAVIGLGVFVVVFIVGSVTLRLGRQLWMTLNPEEPPPPTVGFGLLPVPRFPAKDVDGLEYVFEIPQGALVTFGDRAKVFFSAGTRSNLLALERAKKQATALGFVFEPEMVSGTVYRWNKTVPLQSVLEMDINTGNFTMEVAWETDPGFLQKKLVLNEKQAVSEAKSYLTRAGFLKGDLEEAVVETTLLTASGGEFVQVSSVSEADFIQVDFFRASIVDPNPAFVDGDETETARVLTKDPEMGLARILYSGSRGQGERIVSAEVKYTEVLYEQIETYPVIQPGQAWEYLANGSGYVAREPSIGNKVVVRRMELGYYDQVEEQSYLIPMYVFYGDNEFVGYVPAITPKWYASPDKEVN